MDNKNVFSKNLRYQMEVHGKSRQDISDALGISYFTVTSWTNGTKYPRMDKVEKLAAYFGILKSDLIEDKKEQPTVQDDGLTENQRKLMQFAKSVPDDKAEMILRVMKSIVEAD
jgi:repressor LexA